MNYLLAVDGGGTKTQVICADESGHKVGEGLVGPTNLTVTTVGAASFNLKEGIRQATERLAPGWNLTKMVMGLAGMDTPKEHAMASKTFGQVLAHFQVDDLQLVNDIVIALESGTDKTDAVALISGTGSNCYARNAEGQETKVGGMDYLLTDQGSGFEIGRAVLRFAVKSFDGRIEKTMLEDMVCQHFDISSVGELKDVVYNPLLKKSEIAELSKICVMAFDQGDAVARQIIDHTIDGMHKMVATAMTKLGITGREVDAVLVGGVTKIPYVQERLTEKLTAVCPRIKLIHPDKAPVEGALKLAMKSNR